MPAGAIGSAPHRVPSPAPIRAVTFDVGNTLLPFRANEMDELLGRFAAFVRERVGPCDERAVIARYNEVRREQYRVNLPHLRENDLLERLELTLRAAIEPTGAATAPAAATARCGADGRVAPALLAEAAEAYVEALAASLPLPENVLGLLDRLRPHFRLGVITNYPYSPGTRRLLAAKGLDGFFEAVVISADWAFVKPHPVLFRQAARELGVEPASLLHVGDDWEADIIGAAGAGAQSVYFTGFRDEPDPRRGDPAGRPLAVIDDLEELLPLLGVRQV